MADQAISALTEVTSPNATDMTVVVNAAATKKVQLRNLLRPLGAHVTHSTTQSISNSTTTSLNFDTEREDTDVCHDTVTNNPRLTAKTAGEYLITCQVGFASNTTGFRQVTIVLNGATAIAAETKTPVNGSSTHFVMSVTYRLAVNDHVQVQVFQTSGGALATVKGANYSPEFSMWRISA